MCISKWNNIIWCDLPHNINFSYKKTKPFIPPKMCDETAKGYLWSKLYQILNSQALSCLVLFLSDPSVMLI